VRNRYASTGARPMGLRRGLRKVASSQAVHGPRQEVPRDCQPEGRRVLAELPLDVRQGLARLDQHAGEAVAQRVRLPVCAGPRSFESRAVGLAGMRPSSTARGKSACRVVSARRMVLRDRGASSSLPGGWRRSRVH
jgi:hypothetical protein